MPKSCPNHSQIMRKSFPNHSQIMSKSCPNRAQIIPKSFLNHAQNILCMYHMCIMCAYMYIIGICHWHVSYVDIIWRCDMEISYGDVMWRYHMVMWCGDIIWWCDIRHQKFDFWWVLEHKFHGLIGPFRGQLSIKNNLQNQECHFLKMACYPILIPDSEST